jgi:hypothetical protein
MRRSQPALRSPKSRRFIAKACTWTGHSPDLRLVTDRVHLAARSHDFGKQMATRATQVLKASGLRSFCVADWLRRQFADAQDLIAESKESCIQTMRDTRQWRVAGQIVEAEQFWSQKPSAPAMAAFFRHAQAMDIRDLPDSLEMMERRVAALTAAVNQEIQVVIGSVQVEDARTMKRQTEWMVVLALLAAIYLPMTLVTGIFGMNISEINDDRSFPDRWSAVKAWGVVFSATVGCILFYAVVRRPVRWLLGLREVSRNKALDLEALKIE